MDGSSVSSPSFVGDEYRSYLYGEDEKETQWKLGYPPNYDVVNKLFEDERTKEWPTGSLEETVQRLVKTFEMELVHKVRPQDWKSISKDKFKLSLNGGRGRTPQELKEMGGNYNFFLLTSLPEEFRVYDSRKETLDSSETAFLTAFPRGFALEILEVFTGPPKVVFKFRHCRVTWRGHSRVTFLQVKRWSCMELPLSRLTRNED